MNIHLSNDYTPRFNTEVHLNIIFCAIDEFWRAYITLNSWVLYFPVLPPFHTLAGPARGFDSLRELRIHWTHTLQLGFYLALLNFTMQSSS
jgi:hypothetical protein